MTLLAVLAPVCWSAPTRSSTVSSTRTPFISTYPPCHMECDVGPGGPCRTELDENTIAKTLCIPPIETYNEISGLFLNPCEEIVIVGVPNATHIREEGRHYYTLTDCRVEDSDILYLGGLVSTDGHQKNPGRATRADPAMTCAKTGKMLASEQQTRSYAREHDISPGNPLFCVDSGFIDITSPWISIAKYCYPAGDAQNSDCDRIGTGVGRPCIPCSCENFLCTKDSDTATVDHSKSKVVPKVTRGRIATTIAASITTFQTTTKRSTKRRIALSDEECDEFNVDPEFQIRCTAGLTCVRRQQMYVCKDVSPPLEDPSGCKVFTSGSTCSAADVCDFAKAGSRCPIYTIVPPPCGCDYAEKQLPQVDPITGHCCESPPLLLLSGTSWLCPAEIKTSIDITTGCTIAQSCSDTECIGLGDIICPEGYCAESGSDGHCSCAPEPIDFTVPLGHACAGIDMVTGKEINKRCEAGLECTELWHVAVGALCIGKCPWTCQLPLTLVSTAKAIETTLNIDVPPGSMSTAVLSETTESPTTSSIIEPSCIDDGSGHAPDCGANAFCSDSAEDDGFTCFCRVGFRGDSMSNGPASCVSSGVTADTNSLRSTTAKTLVVETATSHSELKCSRWCTAHQTAGVSTSWEKKCSWKHCSGCDNCAKTEAPKLHCKKWCEGFSYNGVVASWETKCAFKGCNGCDPCTATFTYPKCEKWCEAYRYRGNAAPWETKCKFKACSGCQSCATLRVLPRCEDWCISYTYKNMNVSWETKCKFNGCAGCDNCL